MKEFILNIIGDNKSNIKYILILLIIFFVLVAGQVIVIFKMGVTKAGAVGEAFGVAESIFSGIVIIVIIMALKLQKDEVRCISDQMAEDSFYRLIDLYYRNIDSITFNEKKGRDALWELSKELLGYIKDDNCEWRSPSYIQGFYGEFWGNNERFVAVYYSTVERILTYIKNMNVKGEKNKEYYLKIFFSQLTEGERVLLTLHCISDKPPKLRTLMKKHKLICLCDQSSCNSSVCLSKYGYCEKSVGDD